MKKTLQMLVQGLFVLVLLCGLAGPSGIPGLAAHYNLQPSLLQLAAAAPETIVEVIVQKGDRSQQAEQQAAELGATITHKLSLINAFSARMTAKAAGELAASPAVRWVSLDASVEKSGRPRPTPTPSPTQTPSRFASQSIRPDSGSDTYTPVNHFLDTLGVRSAWAAGLKGQGIGVAVIDSGISTSGDFNSSAGGTRLVRPGAINLKATTLNDLVGHGTHVAGIIGGNGAASGGLYSGIAPEVTLISLKVADDLGQASEADVVAALQWVYEHKAAYNIRVVNLSLNATVEQSYQTDPLDAAVEVLWFNGVVVVTSVGNTLSSGGWYNTVNAAPANDPFVITVGAGNDLWAKDPSSEIYAPFSAFGVSADGFAKPDLIAPGTSIISVYSPYSSWAAQYLDRMVANGAYIYLSGTSMAAPMVSGATALLLQKEPKLNPDQVKYRLTHTGGSVLNYFENGKQYPSLGVAAALAGTTSATSNTGIYASRLLTSGPTPIDWSSVAWNSVAWNSVAWNSVTWNSVAWNSVAWNSVAWNSLAWSDASKP